MASTFTTSLRIEKQATGENKSTWGAKTNVNFELYEDAIAGHINAPVTDGTTPTNLAGVNGAVDTPRNMMISLTGTLTAARTATVPAVSKTYIVNNATIGGFAVTFKVLGSAAGTKEVTLRSGQKKYVYIDSATNLWTSDNWVLGSSAATQRWGIPATVEADGVMDVGKFIEFHNTNADANNFSVRLGTFNASSVGSTTDLFITPTSGAARKIWNDGNDGHTSGLDADTLDGFHATSLNFPVGTYMLFVQTAAPTGWTKLTDALGDWHNRALRITTGTVATGGVLDFTAAFVNHAIVGVVTPVALTEAQLPAHDHTFTGTASQSTGTESVGHTHTEGTYSAIDNPAGGQTQVAIWNATTRTPADNAAGSTPALMSHMDAGNHTHPIDGVSGGPSVSHHHLYTAAGTVGNAGSGQTHTHGFTASNVDMRVKYVDVIIAFKA